MGLFLCIALLNATLYHSGHLLTVTEYARQKGVTVQFVYRKIHRDCKFQNALPDSI